MEHDLTRTSSYTNNVTTNSKLHNGTGNLSLSVHKGCLVGQFKRWNSYHDTTRTTSSGLLQHWHCTKHQRQLQVQCAFRPPALCSASMHLSARRQPNSTSLSVCLSICLSLSLCARARARMCVCVCVSVCPSPQRYVFVVSLSEWVSEWVCVCVCVCVCVLDICTEILHQH